MRSWLFLAGPRNVNLAPQNPVPIPRLSLNRLAVEADGDERRVGRAVELDPFGGDTWRSANAAFQPRRFTSYERDANSADEAHHRRYNRLHSRFDEPGSVAKNIFQPNILR